jgi:cytochrome b pre-mRNA-processing protein 3
MFFKRLTSSDNHDHTVRQVYELIVAKARQPALYEELGVADTFAGRFDMLVLFAVLVMRRLGEGPEAARDLGQALFDAMFRDMDRSMREMGVGDLSVGKRVRKLAEIFSGRAKAYRDAIASGREEELRSALMRNIYPDGAGEQCIRELASYATECVAALDRQQMAHLAAGRLVLPSVTRK